MTIVSQKAVASAKHARKLKDYIEGKDALLRDCINVFEPHRAFEEMAETRRAAGHDRPSRRGAANTVMLHQVLAFLPEEADMNGGPLSPEDCMRYAREYASRRGYDAHQVVLALHEERCEEVYSSIKKSTFRSAGFRHFAGKRRRTSHPSLPISRASAPRPSSCSGR